MHYYYPENEWLIEHCLVCGSVNHIFLTPEAHAWECWACFNRWWIDDLSKDVIIITYNVDEDEADDMLGNAHHYINFAHGHSEIN